MPYDIFFADAFGWVAEREPPSVAAIATDLQSRRANPASDSSS